ncbi:hypothetical protein ONZ45_g13288 [Pleurotus djamor]|nr:hypothetical protein ONZ45_g13288 [Pleurotus djamor]
MSSRSEKVTFLREDLPPTISSVPHPNIARTIVCIHKVTGRNLVLNLDGTANQFSEKSTNVVELFSRLIKDEGQLVYYDSGIGTYARPSFKSLSYIKQVIYHAIDTAIAWNFETIVHAAYKWLSENYQPGDKIFLFGFSRGAYQARVIAGMIEKVGLLHKGNERQIPFAYELYSSVIVNTKRERETSGTNESLSEAESKEEELCRQFKRSLCHKDVKVHFVGAWDTVSSIGVLRGNSLPETVSGMGHVCAFRHALALDERRVKFQPEYANGGLGPRETDKGNVKEVWFSGSHSDIGGGNTLNKNLRNFGPALRWMTYEAMTYGLRIEPYEGTWDPPRLTDSLKGFWNFLEILPFPCLSYQDETSLTWVPHLSAPRKIPNGHLIHQSVLRSMSSNHIQSNGNQHLNEEVDSSNEIASQMPGAFPKMEAVLYASYTPNATLSTTGWNQLCLAYEASPTLDIVEKDPFEDASHALDSFAVICLLTELSTPSSISLGERFSNQLTILHSFLEDETRLASLIEVPSAGGTLLTALGVACRLVPTTARLPKVSQVYEWGSCIRMVHRDAFVRVLQPFSCLGHWKGDENLKVSHVSFSHTDSKCMVLARYSRRCIYFSTWDGSCQPPKDVIGAQGSTSTMTSGGSYIATRDRHGISIIDTTTNPPSVTTDTDEGASNHDNDIRPLCFSEDHKILASSHVEGCIKLWRQEEHKWNVFKRFKSKDSQVWHLAFSRDGSSLAFYIWDCYVNVWSLKDDTLLRLENSQDSLTFAWSPSCDRLFSASLDGTVKVWKLGCEKVEHSFRAHHEQYWTRHLAFRPDGQVLATGGDDGRVRVWRCDTYEQIWDFDIGGWVSSIAFSSDGKRLISGGYWGSIHLWDVDMGDSEGMDYSLTE